MADEVERLAAEVHGLYQAEVRRQGREIRHDDDYASLSEEVKELDRVFVRWHLEKIKALKDEVRDLQAAILELRKAGQEFLDASNAASTQHASPEELRRVMRRWQNTGAELRRLTKSVAVLRT